MDPVIHWTLRLGLALILGVSAISKLRDRDGFRRSLENYRLLSPSLEGVAGLLVPLLELGGAVLILSRAYAGGITLFLFLMALFSGAIIWGLRQGGGFNCGCLGGIEEPVSPGLLLRNALLALLATLAYLEPTSRSLSILDMVTVLLGGSFLFLIYLAFSMYLGNWVRLGELRR